MEPKVSIGSLVILQSDLFPICFDGAYIAGSIYLGVTPDGCHAFLPLDGETRDRLVRLLDRPWLKISMFSSYARSMRVISGVDR